MVMKIRRLQPGRSPQSPMKRLRKARDLVGTIASVVGVSISSSELRVSLISVFKMLLCELLSAEGWQSRIEAPIAGFSLGAVHLGCASFRAQEWAGWPC